MNDTLTAAGTGSYDWILVVVYLSFRPGSDVSFNQFPPYKTQIECMEDKKKIDASIQAPSQWFARCFKRKLPHTSS